MKISNPLKIILLDNDSREAELVDQALQKAGLEHELRLVSNENTYLQALDEFKPDIILSEINIIGYDAGKALQLIQKREYPVPFILITNTVSDQLVFGLIQAGAADYVFKDRIARLPFAIKAAIRNKSIQKEKEQTLTKLKQSEEKYRAIFYNTPIPKWTYDFKTLRFLEVNDAAVSHYGYTREEFLTMTIKDIRPAEDLDQLSRDLKRIEQEPDIRKGHWRHLKKNGEMIIVETTAYFIRYNERKVRMVVVRDVTETVHREKEKEFASNNLAALINNTADLMWSVDRNLNMITSNEAFQVTVQSLIGKRLANGDSVMDPYFKPDLLDAFRQRYQRALAGESFKVIERFDDPVHFWSEISFHPILDGNKVVGTACFSRDITDQKKSEQELRKLEKKVAWQKVQAQKKTTLAILAGQEKERNFIGRELHDNINQILASAKLYLSTLASKNEEFRCMMSYPMGLIDSSVQEIRSLTRGYVAPLCNHDLCEQVQSLLSNVEENTDIRTSLVYQLRDMEMSANLKLNLYRIIQEQINNILKHAHASTIKVTIGKCLNYLSIVIIDDGKGFDASKKRKGIGVSNMINRVELFNGELNIESEPGKGCKVYIVIPEENEGQADHK